MSIDPDSQAAFTVMRSFKDDPQQGDEIYDGGVVSRRVVAREGERVAYVIGPGLGSVKWCSVFAWQLWNDGIV